MRQFTLPYVSINQSAKCSAAISNSISVVFQLSSAKIEFKDAIFLPHNKAIFFI